MRIKDVISFNVGARPSAFGLDISDFSIKIAQLEKKNKRLKLKSFNRTNLPRNTVEGGEIKKEKQLIKSIRNSIDNVRGEPIKTPYAVCSLPEQCSFVKIIQLPKMKRDEIKEAVKWEAEANIPLSLEEVYLDWVIIPGEKDSEHLNILINAAPKELVDKYLQVLRAADIEPVVFEIESVATARSLIKKDDSFKPLLIIDLGSNRTSFIIFAENNLRFTSSISISNQQMISDVAKKLRVNKEEAQLLKFKTGLDKSKKQGEVFNALLPSLVKLVNQIKDYIVFYKDQSQEAKVPQENISKIVLCGGGANLEGLPQYLSGRLKIPVVLGNPWVNIFKTLPKELPGVSRKESLAYATALGLALRGIKIK